MFFRIVSLVMAAIAVVLGTSVDTEHAFAAVLIPAAAAVGSAMLAAD